MENIKRDSFRNYYILPMLVRYYRNLVLAFVAQRSLNVFVEGRFVSLRSQNMSSQCSK
jgi:hypothetical protein